MTVVEISRLIEAEKLVSEEPFIYRMSAAEVSTASFWTTTFGVTQPESSGVLFINSFLREPTTKYSRQTSYNDCVSNEQSFFWDGSTQTLYVHIEHDQAPYTDDYAYGKAEGYTDGPATYIDDIYYDPILISEISVPEQQDLVNYSELARIDGEFQLSNLIDETGQGRLDSLIDENLYGNDVDIYWLPDNQASYTRSDLTQIKSVYIDTANIGTRSVTILFKDKRDSQNIKVPTGVFTTTNYPNLDPELANTVIPVAFGTIRDQTAICTNSTLTSGDVEYRQALTLTSLGTVYVKSGDSWVSVTPSATNLSTGEFTLSAGDARDANGTALDCRVEGSVGIPNTYASDIIKYLNTNYVGVIYNSSNYDTTEWETEETELSSIGYVIDEKKDFFQVIAEIQNGCNVGFRYEINANGQRTIRIDKENRAPVLTAENIEIENRTDINVENDPELLAAIAEVGYAPSFDSGKFLRNIDDSQADEIEALYRQRPTREVETFLTDLAGSQLRADYILDRFGSVRGIVRDLVLMGDRFLTLRIYDLINIVITPADDVDLDDLTITGREFYGLKFCKIISVDPNIKRKTNTISAVIIGNAVLYQKMFYEVGGEFSRAEFDGGFDWVTGG